MPKVFISHAWEDNAISRELADRLRQDGVETWVYYAKVELNGRLPQVFKQAIEWCDDFLLLWSEAAAQSDCVKLEWHRAFFLKKRIISCLLDQTQRSATLHHTLHINFDNFTQGYDHLTQLLNLNSRLEPESSLVTGKKESMVMPELKLSRLRATAKNLSDDEVEQLVKNYNFFDIKRNSSGNGLHNQFEVRQSKDNNVIYDHITGLMWQQGGSDEAMWYQRAEQWISLINLRKYAGFSDWRLPTLEEGMSLLEQEKKSQELCINPIFEQKQSMIWTSDLIPNKSRAWVVFFNYGTCFATCLDFKNYVRAVRSV